MNCKCFFPALIIIVATGSAHAAEGGLKPASTCATETPEYACSRGFQPALPLRFEANLGQAGNAVKFLSRGSGFGLFLTNHEAVLRLVEPKPATVRMTLGGQNATPRIEGIDRLAGKTHYLKGRSPVSWHGDVPAYARVRYADVYPGVDLVYYGNQRQLEYDFVVAPGARPDVIQLHFDGIRGMHIDKEGQLVLRTAGGEILQKKPVAYQQDGDRRVPLEGNYILRGKHRVGFRIASYDSTKPLIIDPVLVYSTYFGGTGTLDQGNAIAVDAAGNAYVAGQTSSTDLLTIHGVQGALRGQLDGFVLKLDPKGTTVIYSTYFGGSGNDEAHSIAIDSAGNAYVTGYTTSSDFPIVNGFQKTRAGGLDAYFLKLNSAGDTILYSSYIGGSADDRAYGLALDAAGNVYITGSTGSTNFPTVNPLQRTNGGGQNDVFVMKIGAGGNVVYSTYAGGMGQDQSYGIAVDASGAAYVTGYSSSLNFPFVNAYQAAFGGGSDDAFLFKVNPAGSAFEYSTLIGGSGSDNAVRVAVDDAGGAYITGYTDSFGRDRPSVNPSAEDLLYFPTVKPYQASLDGGNVGGCQRPGQPISSRPCFDGFITRFAPDGKSLVFSTFYGGAEDDSGTSIVVDRAGSVYVAGYTASFDLPVVNAIQNLIGGGRDAYLLKLTADGGTIIFATYLGGQGAESAVGLAVDAGGNAYVTGLVDSDNFPLVTPFQEANGAAQDAFIAKINSEDIVVSSQFQIAEQGGMSVETRGTRTDAVFGYATAEPATPGTRLNGLGIVDHRQSGAVLTEVGVPAPPFIEIGRMFVDTTESAQTVISIANPNDENASVDFFFTDEAGVTSNFATVTINAHAHFSRFVTDGPLNVPAGVIGALNFTSSLPVAAGGFRGFNNEGGEFLLSNIPIAEPLEVTSQPVVIPQFAEGSAWNTQVVLVNTTEDRMNGEVRFLSPGGPAEPVSPVEVGIGDAFASVLEYDIPPRSAQRIQTAGSTTKSDFPFAAKSGTSFTTPGSGVVQLNGFAVAEATSETPLNGLEILEYRQSNVTNSEIGVVAPPLRQAGRLFVEVNDNVRSMIAIANPAGEEAVVEFSYTDAAGTSSAPVSVTVPAGGQVLNFANDTPISVPSGSSVALSFNSSIPVSATALRFFTNEKSQSVISAIPIADISKVLNQPVVIPQFADGGGWKSQIVLVNTTDDQIHGEVRFFSQGSSSEPGQPIEVGIGDAAASVVEYDIPPRGSQRIETAGTAEALSAGSVYIVPFAGNNTPHAHALLSLQDSSVPLVQTAVEGQLPATNFRLYAEAFGDFDSAKAKSTRTAVAFANPFPSEAAVRLDLTSLDGTVLGTSAPIRIPPNGQVAMFLNQAPGFETLAARFKGFLRVTATSGAITATRLRATYNENGIFLMTTTGPLNEGATSAARLIFPYVTDSSGYTTQIVLTSAAPEQNISGTLRFLSQDATPLQLADLRAGSIHIVPFAGFATPHVHAIVSHQAEGITAFQTAVEGELPATSFRLYAEALGDFDAAAAGSTRTSIALANPYDVPISVRLDLTSFDGRFVGSSRLMEIPANGQLGIFLNQIPGFEGVSAPFKGLLKAAITSGAGFTVAGFRTKVNERGRLLLTTTGPLKENAGRAAQLVFPHIAEGSGYTTQFVVVGASSGQSNSGILSFFNQEGAPLNVTLAQQ